VKFLSFFPEPIGTDWNEIEFLEFKRKKLHMPGSPRRFAKNFSPRKRFILSAVCGYLAFGSTWIFLSDQMLMAFTDLSTITGLSTAKGIAFILLTALMLILALSAIPDRQTAESQNRYRTSEFLNRVDHVPRWISYVFAVCVTLAMLLVRMKIAGTYGQRPMLILFMMPIILSAVLGGLGPGLIATAISSISVNYLGVLPLYSFGIKEPHVHFQWFMLIASGILSSYLSELLHRARRQSEERRILQEISQDQLRQSEARFSTIFHASPMGIDLVQMKDGSITHANDAFLQMFGYSREELIGRTSLELGLYVDPEDRIRIVDQVRKRQRVINFETRFRRKSGETGILLLYVEPIELGKEQFFLSIAIDITSRKQAEKALVEREQYLQTILQTTADGFWVVDDNGRIIEANQAYSHMSGYSLDELLKLNISAIDAVEGPTETAAHIKRVIENGFEIFETLHRRKDGSVFDAEMSATYMQTKGGMLVCFCRDITERKLAEMALKKSEVRFRTVARLSSDFAYSCCLTGHGDYAVDWITDSFYTLSGISESELRDLRCWMSLAHPQDLDMATEPLSRLRPGDCDTREFRIVATNGRILTVINHMECESDPETVGGMRINGFVQDITDRKKVEEEKDKLETKLQQAQKFEAIGTLAGGIAHDFNNLLMGIQGRASMMSLDPEFSNPNREHINAIEEYIRSATNLTKQLLGFARGGKYEVKPIDINELVLSSSTMFGRTKKEIRIHTRCQTLPLVAEVDRGQIEQALLNLYINAWQAMPPGGGELYLETMIVTLDEAYCKPHQVDSGRFVKVSITDTGIGMDEATRLRIFDPFFTTKEKRRGTGLGLASAYGIIKNHGGMITVYSEINHGTTFNIYLPVSGKDAHRQTPLEGGLIKGSATILIVDDEEIIIDVCQDMLKGLGYRVIIAKGGLEAVEAITNMGNDIDMVILDLIMPGMDGGTTFDRIREIKPGVPVLLSSGYAINGQAHKIMSRGCNGFIQKPYSISDLSYKIHNVLEGKL
jgi:two-component system, cell cycle sensor histidine kinase and response regulator CckA